MRCPRHVKSSTQIQSESPCDNIGFTSPSASQALGGGLEAAIRWSEFGSGMPLIAEWVVVGWWEGTARLQREPGLQSCAKAGEPFHITMWLCSVHLTKKRLWQE